MSPHPRPATAWDLRPQRDIAALRQDDRKDVDCACPDIEDVDEQEMERRAAEWMAQMAEG